MKRKFIMGLTCALLSLMVAMPCFAAVNEAEVSPRTIYAIGLTYYGQETSTSCVPACIRMVLDHIDNIDYGEEEIRDNCNWVSGVGTDMEDAASYLNRMQNEHRFQCHSDIDDMDMFLDEIYDNIRYDNMPVIIRVSEAACDNFPFTELDDHAVLARAYDNKDDEVGIRDPWAGYIGDTDNDSYYVSGEDLFTAYVVGGMQFIF